MSGYKGEQDQLTVVAAAPIWLDFEELVLMSKPVEGGARLQLVRA